MLSMKEEIYMNRTIETCVIYDEENAYICFKFDQSIKLSITSDNANDAKSVFYEILKYIIDDENIEFTFTKCKDDLFNDTAEKYINDLNSEIQKLKSNFNNPSIETIE